MEAVNTEKIMQEIRSQAKQTKYSEPVAFEDVAAPMPANSSADRELFNENHFRSTVSGMSGLWNTPYYHPLAGNGLKKMLVRIIRRILRPVGIPMMTGTAAFNQKSMEAMNELLQYIDEQKRKEIKLNYRINELEAMIGKLQTDEGKKQVKE